MPTGCFEREERYMQVALEEARKAYENDEVPVGAVITLNDTILSRAHNKVISSCDPSAHAEMLAIRGAAECIKNYRLAGTTLYVTLEPCIMCAGVILQARVSRIVFGAFDSKGGAVESLYNLLSDRRLNHRVEVVSGVLGFQCSEILSRFFRGKRI